MSDPKRYFVSEYTDGPATRWNVIDRQSQEWVRRFSTEQEASAYADDMNNLTTNRSRVAYEAFRGGLISGLDADVPRWENAPSWVRDVVVVAYLQGKLDAPKSR